MPPRTLIALPHRHGVAEVWLGRHGAVLTGEGPRGPGTQLQGHRPAVHGLPEEVTLSGGLLPPGAVRAVVLDRAGRDNEATCGNGAWLVLLDQPTIGEAPVVRFLDGADELVPVPPPAGVRLEPVDDAVDPCPACRALEWRKVVAAPESWYGADGAGRPTAARCRRCGHEEDLGVLYAAEVTPSWPVEEDIDDTGAEIAAREAEARSARTADARSTPFRVYGLAARSPVSAGLTGSGGTTTSVTLRYETSDGFVDVRTDTDEWLESPPWLARGSLEGMADWEDCPDLSETAVLLWLNARTRETVAEAHRAPVREVAIAIDGEPGAFAAASVRGRFAAAARLPDATVVVSGHGSLDGVALETVAPEDLRTLR